MSKENELKARNFGETAVRWVNREHAVRRSGGIIH
jgi:hypothetical protein